MSTIEVSFGDEAYAPVRLAAEAPLAEHLDAVNSPLLFGCRTGICGTCLVRLQGPAKAPDDDEQEMLEVFAPDDPRARLACQLACTGDVVIRRHPDAP
ncbi:MAG: 2Fe-2S iron-sulfur cluster-binding protein [Myxococcota bacterium]